VKEVRQTETVEVPVRDFREVMGGVLLVACRAAHLDHADIAAQANAGEQPVRASLHLLDRLDAVGRDRNLYTVTLLKCTSGRTIEDVEVATGVILRVERRPLETPR
jgi:hypothetical protein